MARITAKGRRTREVGFAESRGSVCDARCREASVRERQFGRRVSTAGGIRVS